jgi:predicted RNA-binding Zn ribbon-like protein
LRGKPLAETFRCPGGELCLDFCNSGQGARNRSKEEWLTGFADLIDWLEAAGAIEGAHAARLRAGGAQSPQAAHQLWLRALEFREALARVFLARTEGRSADEAEFRKIEAEHARTAPFARLAASAGGFAWGVDAKSAALDATLRPLVNSAVELLTSSRLARLRRCGNETCYWLFLDETRNCSRRWCEMASCGNVMKVRRHRAKQQRGESSRDAPARPRRRRPALP